MSDKVAETFANRRIRWEGDWLYVPGPSVHSFWYRVRFTGTCDDGSPDYQCEHSTFGQPYAPVVNPYVRWLLASHYQREREICAGEREPLTKNQRRVLDFLVEHNSLHGYMPSFPEIAAQLGGRSLSTVFEYLTELQRKGYIHREYNKARGITILPAGKA